MKAQIAVAALNNAVARRGHVAGCVLHSDRAIDLGQTRAMLSYAEALDEDDPSWRQLRRAYLEKAATAGDCDAMLSLSGFFVEDEEGADSEAALRWEREGRRRRGF